MLFLLLFLVAIVFSKSEIPSALLKAEHRGETCDCMEYWTCINSGGQPFSYCGPNESAVCCLIENASPQTKPKCGIKGFDSGQEGIAEPSEWPWHVAIVEEEGFYYVCGGSLIDEKWILTAAHCIEPYVQDSPPKLKVRLGEYDVSSRTEKLPHEDRNVAKIIIHPHYDNNTLLNDLALILLERPAVQRHHIDIVCLPEWERVFTSRSKCFLTGWGKLAENGTHSEILKEVTIPLWSDQACEDALKNEFGRGFILPNSTLCGGGLGRDACDGDGGGPLVCEQEGQWFQTGIVSYGFGCGRHNKPGVYTKVQTFTSWIKATVLNVSK